MFSHYLPAYAPTSGVRYRAICGRYIFPHEHALTPNCAECQRLIAEDDAREAQDDDAIKQLQDMEPLRSDVEIRLRELEARR